MPYTRLIDQFEKKAGGCSSDAALRSILEDVVRELGFRYFALLHHSSLRPGGAKLIRIDNYPPGWEEEMHARGFVADDPVHLASGRTNVGFAWSDLAGLVVLTIRHQEILDRSGRHGIGPGYTIPANVPGEPGGSCSFAMKCGGELPVQRLLCAEQIGAHAFRTARRIHDYPAAGQHPNLSRRELQCRHLMAAGKTDWEIAKILGISVETVHCYVKRARAAYDVVSRTQLVVHGLRDSWISFDDAIPRMGEWVRAAASAWLGSWIGPGLVRTGRMRRPTRRSSMPTGRSSPGNGSGGSRLTGTMSGWRPVVGAARARSAGACMRSRTPIVPFRWPDRSGRRRAIRLC